MPETSRTIPREQDAPRTLIVVMILLMLLGVGAAFFWIQRVGVAEEVVGRPAPLARYGPIFRFEEILAEPAKGNLLGRDVALWSAPVQRVTGNWLFWIGAAPARSVPVVLLGEQAARQHERQTVVRTGDTLAVFGTVRAVRGVSFRDEPWDLPQQEWERLARAQVYISALLVEHVAPRFPRAAVEPRGHRALEPGRGGIGHQPRTARISPARRTSADRRDPVRFPRGRVENWRAAVN